MPASRSSDTPGISKIWMPRGSKCSLSQRPGTRQLTGATNRNYIGVFVVSVLGITRGHPKGRPYRIKRNAPRRARVVSYGYVPTTCRNSISSRVIRRGFRNVAGSLVARFCANAFARRPRLSSQHRLSRIRRTRHGVYAKRNPGLARLFALTRLAANDPAGTPKCGGYGDRTQVRSSPCPSPATVVAESPYHLRCGDPFEHLLSGPRCIAAPFFRDPEGARNVCPRTTRIETTVG